MTDPLDDLIAAHEVRRRCPQCGDLLSELARVRGHGDRWGWRHKCGVAFSAEFLDDFYGIKVPADAAGVSSIHRP